MINGWISHLTKNTASARLNFSAEETDEAVLEALHEFLGNALREAGRGDEARRELWELKDDKIDREYPVLGKSTARIRLRRVKA